MTRWNEQGERVFTAHDMLEARRAERARFRAIVRTVKARYLRLAEATPMFEEIPPAHVVLNEVLEQESVSWKRSQG